MLRNGIPHVLTLQVACGITLQVSSQVSLTLPIPDCWFGVSRDVLLWFPPPRFCHIRVPV